MLASCSRQASVPATGPPDRIVLVTVDTLRADHLGCYGYDRIATPSIDRLARDGILFRQAIAQVPLTLPSHCSILTIMRNAS